MTKAEQKKREKTVTNRKSEINKYQKIRKVEKNEKNIMEKRANRN